MSQPELRLECLVVELFGSRAASLSEQRKPRCVELRLGLLRLNCAIILVV